MSDGTGTWSTRLIGAACAVVIVVGAFAISGHKSGESKKPNGRIVGAATPSATGSPSNAPAPKPTPSAAGAPSTVPSQASSRVSPPSPLPSQSGVATSPTASAVPSNAPSPSGSPTSSQHTTTAIPAGVLGSFSYATTGSEQTNIPGTKRIYPSTTTFTNTRAGDCVNSTWKPVSEHVQTQQLCADGKTIRIASDDQTISFFGINSSENFACGQDAYLYQPGVKAGHVWNYKCTSADATATQAAHVLGYETMSVGGTAVRVLHVQLITTVSGAESGKSTQDYWIGTATPLLMKETGTVSATQKGIQYQETYSLTLDSLTPKS
jgi:hypothetical protein